MVNSLKLSWILITFLLTGLCNTQEKLIADPGDISHKNFMKGFKAWDDYDPWKLNYKGYLYKDFYPSEHERGYWETVGPRPRDTIIDQGDLGYWPTWSAGHSSRILGFRFFHVDNHPHMEKNEYCDISDWSGYELLRIDIKSVYDAHFWVAMEDEIIQPPVVGNFDLSENTWATIEIDLEDAVSNRGMDLTRMWNLWIDGLTKDGMHMNNFNISIRNIRLCKRGTPAPYSIMNDSNATVLPDPPPAKPPPAPDKPTVLAALQSPVLLEYRSLLPVRFFSNEVMKRGGNALLNVVDKEHVLLAYEEYPSWFLDPLYSDVLTPMAQLFSVQTVDGGKTWTGIGGTTEPTYLDIQRAMASHVVDANGSALMGNQDGCFSDPGPRQRVIKFSYLGNKGWTWNQKYNVLDEESRHCIGLGYEDYTKFVRLSSGRIWAVFVTETRLVPDWWAIAAKYSDDDGTTWLPWRIGKLGSIPVTHRGTTGQAPLRPLGLVPYKDHVAVFLGEYDPVNKTYKTLWTRFNGTSWLPLEKVCDGFITSAASLGGEDIFVSGVMHYENGNWVKETTAKGIFSKSGNTVFLFKYISKRIDYYIRHANGLWEGPVTLADSVKEMCVPQFSPANMGAVAYT
ncbi:MAG: hypothetical protein ABIA63_02030, partial [bacterium]